MSFSGTTMAFFGQMPIFKTSGTSYVPAFGTTCCCPGLTTALVYVEVGDGIKWFKPWTPIVDFDSAGNIYAWGAFGGVGQTKISKYDPQGNETVLATFAEGNQYEIDVDASGNAYLFGNSVYRASSGGVDWTAALSGLSGHYSSSRNKCFISGANAFQVLNASTGTVEQFIELGMGVDVALSAGLNAIQTDGAGNVYVALTDTNPGGGDYVAKFTGSATSSTWTTSTTFGATVPLKYDSTSGSVFCYANLTGTVIAVDSSTGTAAPINYSNDWTGGNPGEIESDSSGNIYISGQSFGGTNYALIRYDSGTAYWGFRPSNFFDFNAPQFGVDPSGTAIATSLVFEYAKRSQPLF